MLLTSRTITIILQAFIFIYPFMVFIRQSSGELHHALQKFVLLSLVSLLLWLIFLSRWIIHKQTTQLKMNKVGVSLLLLAFIIVVSTFLSIDQYISIYGTKYRYEGAIALLSYITLFFFSYHFLPEKSHKKVFIGLAIGAFFAGMYGIIQHYYPRVFKLDFIRAESFFDHANFFGSYLVLMMTLVSMLYLSSKKFMHTLLLFLINSTMFLALIFTTTRSAWLGVTYGIIFLSIFIVLKRKFLWKRWAILLIGFSIIFILINISNENNYFNRANTIVKDAAVVISEKGEGRDSVGSSRWYIWRNAFPLIENHAFVGSGPDTFALVFPGHYENLIFDKAHNEYLQIAITLGIPALLLYLFILFQILLKGFKKAVTLEGQQEIIQYGLLAMVLGYLLQAFFNISVVPVAPFFWIVLGMLYKRSKA